MEQVDKLLWKQYKAEATNKVTQQQFKLICRLHAKYMEHKYIEPCSCNQKQIKRWIADIDLKYEKD